MKKEIFDISKFEEVMNANEIKGIADFAFFDKLNDDFACFLVHAPVKGWFVFYSFRARMYAKTYYFFTHSLRVVWIVFGRVRKSEMALVDALNMWEEMPRPFVEISLEEFLDTL